MGATWTGPRRSLAWPVLPHLGGANGGPLAPGLVDGGVGVDRVGR